MSLFDMIAASLRCPDTGAEKDQRVQIEWAIPCPKETYHIGDSISDILPLYDNKWVKTKYLCLACSPIPEGWTTPRVDDQRWHLCYVKVDHGVIAQVLSEEDFSKLGIEDYVSDE